MMNATVLVPAAGIGRRMSASIHKQYLDLAGRPILAHTLALFERHPSIDSIYPILPAEDISYCQTEIIDRFRFNKVRRLVAGGAERQDSVLSGLRALQEEDLNGDAVVLIHDGVRPLFDATSIPRIVDTVREHGGCVVGVPVKDTIKVVAGGRISGSPERQHLWQAQTPQAFRYELILRAYQEADRAGFRGTDDASLVTRLGEPVMMVEGSYRNLKVTTPDDLVVAEALLKERETGQ
ncbi:MAG: 2-C-methyl-D-erythritol 4-phosphate cytidylyltransferase [Desulfuromonadales bacterium]|jgi:2-C-methyl-D-erythritol 4-phosphate cytidylyltransferase|nr:2-C-methyl-D-erythritol 4-phosphate cytidylyltransferase [Desulfuromonadales bacterium]